MSDDEYELQLTKEELYALVRRATDAWDAEPLQSDETIKLMNKAVKAIRESTDEESAYLDRRLAEDKRKRSHAPRVGREGSSP